MKIFSIIVIVLLVVIAIQSQSNGGVVLLPIGAPSACAWPSGASYASAMALCATTSGLYAATNGGAFAPLVAPAGVSSFNGRTGAVTLQNTDVLPLVKGFTCTGATHSNTGSLSTSSTCTFQ